MCLDEGKFVSFASLENVNQMPLVPNAKPKIQGVSQSQSKEVFSSIENTITYIVILEKSYVEPMSLKPSHVVTQSNPNNIEPMMNLNTGQESTNTSP